MLKKILVLILIFATLLPTLLAESDALEAARGRPAPPPFAADQVLVNFQPGVTTADIATFYAKHGLVEKRRLGARPGEFSRLRLAQTKPGKMANPDGFLRTLTEDSRVEYAELNYILSIIQTPNDPNYSQLWGMGKIDAPQAWNINTGSANVIVGVIDTGVNYNHPDLIDNIWTNLVELNGTAGVDDDDNGYIDDIHGWDAYNNDGDPMDDHFHGSHVAGTIGAKGNNNKGVAGVNWEVKIAACKFLSASGGGTTAGAIACFDYFNTLKAKGHNVLVTNNSWGGGGFSKSLETAMKGDILHAAAAGNSNNNNDAGAHYPSSYNLSNIIAVAATDSSDNYASFSSYGETSVDLAAPGVGILSTVLGNKYATYSGTSMATPHVAGAAALIWAVNSGLSAVAVKDLLMFGVDPLNATKKTVTNGRLNVYKSLSAMEDDEIAPAEVTNLAVSGAGISSLTLTWTATGDDGTTGTASSYDVRYSTSTINDESWNSATQATGEPAPQPSGDPETFTITGLLPSTTYYTALKVKDNVGNESPMSNVVSGSTDPAPTELQDNMENGPGQWTATGLWNLHDSRWSPNSESHAWYYGQPTFGDYDTGAANSGTLTSAAVDLTGATDPTLNFYYWRQVESYASGSYDRTYVEVSYDGSLWTRVWQKDSSDPSESTWKQASIPLNSAIVYVRFGFNTVDSAFNNFEGWYIDDVEVQGVSSGTGTITGQVTQAGGTTPIPGALVQVDDTSFSATANSDGVYSIANVPNDTYNVTASATGFESQTKSVTVASTTVANFPLVATALTPPAVATGGATSVTADSATLNGNLSGLGTAGTVNVSFEYGITTAYGSTTALQAKTATGTFSAAVSGLLPDTLYHIRAKAVGDGTVHGSDMTFTTATAPADTVTILKANYNWKKGELTLEASSSQGGSVVLEVFINGISSPAGTLAYNSKQNKYKGKIAGLTAKPAEVVVSSSGGGSATVSGSDIGGKG